MSLANRVLAEAYKVSNPDFPEAEIPGGRKKMVPSVRRKLNSKIHDITLGIKDQIPLGSIRDLLTESGFGLYQEDGTPWGGFLTGRDGHASLDVGATNSILWLSWHKFDTGRYETVAYLS